MKPFQEERDEAAKLKADNFKGLTHPNGVDECDPTISDLEIHFEAGADWALQSQLVKQMAEALKILDENSLPIKTRVVVNKSLAAYHAAISKLETK